MSKQGNGNGNGKMTMTRRDFIKTTAAAGAAGGMLDLAAGVGRSPAVPAEDAAVAKRVPTTCACCSVGCGQIVDVDSNGNAINVYGDPNHVTNLGANCPKGAASIQWINGDRRLGVTGNALGITGPVYRKGTDQTWTSLTWDQAIDLIATRLKAARDSHGLTPAGADNPDWSLGGYVNGQNSKSIAFLGCSHATNEENWVYRKLIANLGTNNTEHQARI